MPTWWICSRQARTGRSENDGGFYKDSDKKLFDIVLVWKLDRFARNRYDSARYNSLEIHGRHDPVIVPRAVVVVEAMCALTIADALLGNMGARLDKVQEFYKR